MEATGRGNGRHRSAAELERELEETRTEMHGTLDAIAHRLSPEELTRQAVDYFNVGPKEFAVNLGDAVRSNPVPATLAGLGLAWLLWADRHPRPPRRPTAHAGVAEARAGEARERTAEGAEHARAAAQSAVGGVRERGREAVQRAGERWDEARAQSNLAAVRARRAGTDLSDGVRRAVQEQPLVVGAVGIAVGALIGLALPRTRTESTLVGAQRDRTLARAQAAAAEGAVQAAHKGREAAEQVAAGAATAEPAAQPQGPAKPGAEAPLGDGPSSGSGHWH